MGTKSTAKTRTKRTAAPDGTPVRERPQDGVSPTAAAEKKARKRLRRAARRADRHVAALQASVEELYTTACVSSRAVLDTVESSATAVRAQLDETRDDLVQRRARLEETQRAIELLSDGCTQRMTAAVEQERELQRLCRDARVRIATAETELVQSAESASAAIVAKLEVLLEETAQEVERERREALVRVEQAVHATEVQGRAVLHRSSDRIGAMLAAVETQVDDAISPPSHQFEPTAATTEWPSPAHEIETIVSAAEQADPAEVADLVATQDEDEDDPLERGHMGARSFEWHGTSEAEACSVASIEPDAETESWPSSDLWAQAQASSVASIESEAETDSWSSSNLRPNEGTNVSHEVDTREDQVRCDYPPARTRNGRVVGEASEEIAFDGVPTTVKTPLVLLLESARELARRGSEHVLLHLSQRVQGTAAQAVLRLDVLDREDWWDTREVPVRTRAKTFEPVVLDLGKLIEVLDALESVDELQEVELTVDRVVTIEGHPLTRCDERLVPEPPNIDGPTERVNLRTAGRSGLVMRTPNGYLAIPPHLVAHLRADGLTEVDVAISWPTSVLAARTADTSAKVTGRCLALLEVLDEDAPIDRRTPAGNEVSQLIVALSAETTADELERMLKVGVGYVRRRAAAHPMIRMDLLRDILVSGNDAMRASAASNPSIDPELCQVAAHDRSAEVRAAMAANPATPPKLLAGLAFDTTTHVRANAALNPHASPEVLARLATDADPAVRAAIAQRPDTGEDLLRTLAADVDDKVCAAVAANPSCPPELFEGLVSIAPIQVLKNPSTPEVLLAAASFLDTASFRAAVAANPTTPILTLQRLAQDQDHDVLQAIANNDAASDKLRRKARRRISADE